MLRADRGEPEVTGPTYQHEDYQIPPATEQHPALPEPTSDAEVEQWLQHNALYPQPLAKPVRCDLPAFDHVSATVAQKTARLQIVIACLVRVWGPTLEAAGFTITHPTVTVYESPMQTKCGRMPMGNAVYCDGDQNLYFAADSQEVYGAKKAEPWAYESTAGHEFVHSIQGRVGIIPATNWTWSRSNKEERALALRRDEAQADCLAGMFFNATQESLGLGADQMTSLRELNGQVGKGRRPSVLSTHPQAHIRQKWFTIGTNATTVGECNTHLVPPEEVA